jgi:hypothetical protein
MKLRTSLAIAAVLASCPLTFGKTLKPDHVISITNLEHLDDKTGKSYRVNAKSWEQGKTSGSEPTLYYQLLCGTGAAHLEVGQLYKAAEASEKGTKILVIFDVNPEGVTNDLGIGCDIEFVKSADNPKR